jgi:hypothetical protein
MSNMESNTERKEMNIRDKDWSSIWYRVRYEVRSPLRYEVCGPVRSEAWSQMQGLAGVRSGVKCGFKFTGVRNESKR